MTIVSSCGTAAGKQGDLSMKNLKIISCVAGLGLALVAGQAKAANIYDITTGTNDGWVSTYDNAGAGTVVLSGAQPRNGLGSAKFDTTGAADRSRLGTFGSFGAL